MNDVEKPIMRLVDAYKSAVFEKDVDAFVALYDRHVCVFDMWGKWSYDGVESWRAMVTGWFGSLGADRVAVDIDIAGVAVAQELAVAHGFVTYRGVSAQGKELRAMHNRLSWAIKQQGDAWKIIHEHTSAPVDFETSKAMLHR